VSVFGLAAVWPREEQSFLPIELLLTLSVTLTIVVTK
jgi:hypothetical protein